MSLQDKLSRAYMIRLWPHVGIPNMYSVAYVPRGLQYSREPGGRPKKVSEYIASVNVRDSDTEVTWTAEPPTGQNDIDQFDDDAKARALALDKWLRLLNSLIQSVKDWVTPEDWSTREIEKPMEESDLGSYKVPALLLQKALNKFLLEPVARDAPGSEGLVDLYLMPSYDDIASLYYYKDRWNIHYMEPGIKPKGDIRKEPARPLTKANLLRVLREMQESAQ